MRYLIKYALFRILKLLPNVRILTIMPFALEPRFAKVAHGWIYDPQFWDLSVLPNIASAERSTMAEAIQRVACGRRVVAAIGGQGRLKGFDFFTRLYCENEQVRKTFLFVAAGKVESECRSLAEQFVAAGGLLIDRFISDDELYGVYDAADLVWACYAPNYDQASGIFGRALQFGRQSIVRKASYMHDLGRQLELPIIALDPEAAINLSGQSLVEAAATPPYEDAAKRNVAKMREQAEAALVSAFGV